MLDALAWWAAVGVAPVERLRIAMVAGYSPTSGNFANLLGGLRSAGLIDYPAIGRVALTDGASALVNRPKEQPTGAELHERIRGILTGPQWKLLAVLIDEYPAEISRDELGQKTEYSATSGNFNNLLGQLRSLGLVEYPQRGAVAAGPLLFI